MKKYIVVYQNGKLIQLKANDIQKVSIKAMNHKKYSQFEVLTITLIRD